MKNFTKSRPGDDRGEPPGRSARGGKIDLARRVIASVPNPGPVIAGFGQVSREPVNTKPFTKSLAYVAFLRGINVAGNTIISMEDLKKAFASLGFANIRTVLASGNVVFETVETDPAVLTTKIEQKLQSRFGFEIAVRVRTGEQVQALVASNPFKKTKVTAQTRLHVTFLPLNLDQGLKVLQRLKGTDFEIVRVSAGEVCSTVGVSATRGTSDLMKVVEKEFGRKITTRTWNTVERIGKLLES